MKFYFWQLLIAFDQLLNTIFLGWADETLSSRAYRASRKTGSWRWGVAAYCINAIFFNKNHCKDAFEGERSGLQLPPEFRKT